MKILFALVVALVLLGVFVDNYYNEERLRKWIKHGKRKH